MAYRTLEVTLISSKDLKDVSLFSKMEVYAVVSLSGDPRSKQRTSTDRGGGRNPTWNTTVRFNVPADDYGRQVLHILLRAERALGDRDVGEVHIPLSELLDTTSGDGPKFVSYQVRKCTSGKPKGVLNLSYKIGENIAAPAAYPPPGGLPKSDQPVTAYAPAGFYPPPGKAPKADEPLTAYPPPGKAPKADEPLTAYPPLGKTTKADEPVTAYPPTAKTTKADEPVTAYPPTAKAPKADNPVTAYPAAGSSSAGYPPYGAQPYPPPAGYRGYQPPPYGYAPPPPQGYAPPPPPHQGGYGYQPAGYGNGAAPPVAQPQKKNKFGMGLGAGLIGGALGGLLIGDVISDASAYDSGYDAGFDDAGGFDF